MSEKSQLEQNFLKAAGRVHRWGDKLQVVCRQDCLGNELKTAPV